MNIYSQNDPWKSFDVSEQVELFIANCRSRRLKARTIEFYSFHLEWFLKWCNEVEIHEVHTLDTHLMRQYCIWFQSVGTTKAKSGHTLHSNYRVTKSFFEFLVGEDIIDANPFKKIKAPKRPKRILPALTDEEVLQIVEYWSRWEKKPRNKRNGLDLFELRNLALFYFLLDTGLRVQEASDVQVCDIDLRSGRVFVRSGKGDKDRVTFMGERTRKYVREYLRLLPAEVGSRLWIGQYGPMSSAGIQMVFKRLAREIDVQVSPHKIRRTFAISMLRNGADIYRLKEMMGHSDLRTLERYLEIREDDLAKVHKRCSPGDSIEKA